MMKKRKKRDYEENRKGPKRAYLNTSVLLFRVIERSTSNDDFDVVVFRWRGVTRRHFAWWPSLKSVTIFSALVYEAASSAGR